MDDDDDIAGFNKNPSCWRIFLQKVLANAEAAPESCFKKVGWFSKLSFNVSMNISNKILSLTREIKQE